MISKKEILLSYMYDNESKVDGNFLGISTKEISEALNMQRSNTSALLNELVKEKRICKISGKPVLYKIAKNTKISGDISAFNKLIGHQNSLQNAVQLAKAAVIYPESSMNTLIFGESGSGLSYFPTLMYEFAIEQKIIKNNAPFITFNCSYYVNDEKELLIELFEKNNGGAFNQAKDGVLVISHVDLLQPDAKKRLFEFIKQRENKDFILICTITGKTRHLVNEVFYKNFPVHIELPSLTERSMEEKLELIEHFFLDEAEKVNKEIRINSELLRCFLLYYCQGNVKQLKNDIKIGCANAYVREVGSNEGMLRVFISDCHSYVRKGFIFYKKYRDKIEALIPENYTYTFSPKGSTKKEESVIKTKTHDTIYEIIERRVSELRKRDLQEEDIMSIVSADVESDLSNVKQRLEASEIDREMLNKLVDEKLINSVDNFLKQASKNFGRVYPVSIFHGICIQLSSALKDRGLSQRLSNEKIMEIVEKYKDEYTFVIKYVATLEKDFNVIIPIDAVIFLTMFICEEPQGKSLKHPSILIAMHGTIASSVLDTVSMIYKNHNIYAYDLALDKDMNDAYEELKTLCKMIDQGEGILAIYDMGSIYSMLHSITQETGLHIKMVEIPITTVVLDCAIKLGTTGTVDMVYEDIIKYGFGSFGTLKKEYQRIDKESNKVIITLCRTGEGSAKQIKNYLEMNLNFFDVDIVALAVENQKVLLSELNKRKENQNIMCIIGTYNPKIHDIPYISVAKLFDTPVDKLSMLLALKDIDVEDKFDYSAVYEYLKEQLPLVDIDIIKIHLPKVLKRISNQVEDFTINEEVGLFMHITCSISRIKSGESLPLNIHKNQIISRHKKLFYKLKEILSPLEKAMNVTFDDDELATIIEILI